MLIKQVYSNKINKQIRVVLCKNYMIRTLKNKSIDGNYAPDIHVEHFLAIHPTMVNGLGLDLKVIYCWGTS